MIITVTLNPAVDKTVLIDNFTAGSVNRVSDVRLDAGGKGINVSKVIASLGGESLATGILGGNAGTFIKEYLDSSGIANNFVTVQGETRTNLKIVDSVKGENTDINEIGPNISRVDIEQVKSIMHNNQGADNIIVLSGSVPAGVSKDIYKELILTAKQSGSRTILDADGELLKYGLEAGPYLIKPNIHELERLFGVKIYNIETAIKYSLEIKNKFGIEVVVVSIGEEGALFISNTSIIVAEGIKVKVGSTVGAGDSMVAALAYSINRGYTFEDTVRLAVAAGTANVMTNGTQPAELELINGFIDVVKIKYINNLQ
jgi:1-phosphofructokinase